MIKHYCNIKKRIVKSLSYIDLDFFITSLILIVISSAAVFLEFPEFVHFRGIVKLFGIAALQAIFLSVLYYFTPYKLKKFVRLILYFTILLALFLDVFLFANWGMTINENIFSVVEGTNVNESFDFLCTYFNVKTILLIILIVVVAVFSIHLIPKLVVKYVPIVGIKCFIWIALLVSIIEWSCSVYSYLSYGFGGHIAAYSTVTRIARAGKIYIDSTYEAQNLISKMSEMTHATSENRCTKMVVVIGESYSKYHSQLYGYEKETSPLLNQRVEKGDLFLFTDVVTPMNDTERAFRSIYSLGEHNNDYCQYALFPYVFRLAGFNTNNIDNLDLAKKSGRIKDSKELSDLMFHERNNIRCKYDEEIIDMINIDQDKSQLFVIKLQGQHYTYANTFPKSFAHFSRNDYEDLDKSDNQKQIIADYDNSTMYNDYVVNEIINKFTEENAVVIYFSDHGEEIYEERDYMGHGGTTPFLKYQVEIPFMIWMSQSYKELNPNIVNAVKKNLDKPYTTDDVSHTILDMAGIKFSQFVPERSIVNDAFNPRKERIVCQSIVYNK